MLVHREVRLAVGVDSFGRNLERLLRERGVPPAELARAIGVDRSYVSKWLRGERTPGMATPYVAQIAGYLLLSDRERARLEQSQVETLRTAPPTIRTPRPSQPTERGKGEKQIVPGHPSPDSPVLRALRGVGAPLPGDDTITITSQASAAPEGPDPTAWDPYRQALRDALRGGWRLRELWRLNDDPARLAELAAHILDMVGMGRYEPRYFTRYGILEAPYEVMIVPGQAAFQFIATTSARSVDTIFLALQGDAATPLRDHAELLARQTDPVFERYPVARRAAFAQVLAAVEAMTGGRMMVKHGLTLYTEPEEWSHPDSHWARRMARMGADVDAMVAIRTRRLATFRRNVRLFPYRDICPMGVIHEMVETGAYARDDAPGGYDAASGEVRAEHLRSAIAALATYDNYALALLDEHETARFNIRPDTWWAVVGGTRAMLNVRVPDGRGQLVDSDLDITEPTIAAGFAHHFDTIWDRIAPQHRDKTYVIQWLRQQLAQLEAR